MVEATLKGLLSEWIGVMRKRGILTIAHPSEKCGFEKWKEKRAVVSSL